MYYLTKISFLLLLYGVNSERNVWQDISVQSKDVSGTPVQSKDNVQSKVNNLKFDIPCTSTIDCDASEIKNSVCIYGECNCNPGYYLYNSTLCTQCPGLGEGCSTTNCCYSTTMYLTCNGEVCECAENYIGLCGNTDTSQRYRFQKVAQFILAIGLIFTTVIIVILFWKACSSGVHSTIPHVDSFVSLNSIQRLVLLRLQDRPPTYSQIYQPMKRQTASRRIQTLPVAPAYEEPPPYSETPASNHVYENRIFFINEQSAAQTIDTNTTETLPHVTIQPVSEENKPELHI